MQLKPYQEIVGNLSNIITEDHVTIAIFSMMFEVDFPQDSFKDNDLKKFIGKRIGILNSNGKYRIRIIKRKGGN